jgi:hypothetical protein
MTAENLLAIFGRSGSVPSSTANAPADTWLMVLIGVALTTGLFVYRD